VKSVKVTTAVICGGTIPKSVWNEPVVPPIFPGFRNEIDVAVNVSLPFVLSSDPAAIGTAFANPAQESTAATATAPNRPFMFVSYPRRRYKMIQIIIAATPTVAAAVKMLQKSFRLSTSQPDGE